MGQVLVRGKNLMLDVDRSFVDGGSPPKYALVGGQTVLISEGCPPQAEVFQRGEAFFFGDGSPVKAPEAVNWLPEPYRGQALRFLDRGGRGVGRHNPQQIRPRRKIRARKISFKAEQAGV